ncbi:bifunctional glutamate--cysteine ligase/glutathione synthetase [Candidatus Epulonipiscioides gigas]|nr:bifunctional glutamate--cysteine ligase/glutathione synthetase [Epulopiscium sp. SCG-C07WGA-EpuloA2]
MINTIKINLTTEEILTQHIGVEREGLRCDVEGNLATTKHPDVFGGKLLNPYITTDFSESQLEFITPALKNATQVYDFLENLYNIAVLEIGDEYIWPQSMPCTLPDDAQIPIATFCHTEKGAQAYCYRMHLLQKYGGKKQVVSGIHYNFSFNEKIIDELYKASSKDTEYKEFRNDCYLKVARNYLRYRWLIIYLLGGSSVVHKTYEKEVIDRLENEYIDSCSSKGALSYRNGECGYANKNDLYPDYTNITAYVESINNFVIENKIESPKELYAQVRIKAYNNDDLLTSLKEDGINYLEFRSIDINPFDKAGIKKIDLEFLSIFNIFLLLKEESNYKNFQKDSNKNQFTIAQHGFLDTFLLMDGKEVKKSDWAKEILLEIKNINETLNLELNDSIEYQLKKIEDPKKTYAHKIFSKVRENGYINTHLELAKAYKQDAYNNRYLLKGFENLELSTQQIIKESIKRGININVIDPLDNFIRLEQNGHIEYIKQATKTSKDTYISMLIMENKLVTKKVLSDNNINVPKGDEITAVVDIANKKSILNKYQERAVVIKPKSTNFGLGISIFKEPASMEDLLGATEIAFKYDDTILVEEFAKGNEYRFIVIGDKVIGILNRVPANVIGNGNLSIRELVEIKNQDPLRGKGYKTPLEKIYLDENSALFLKQQSLNFDYIPKLNEIVYLRENSNISTGGDSIDYTDDIAPYFKEIAVRAAHSAGANICGVDMMIEDITAHNKNYSIIELNFNPAIHIHHYPYKGKGRNIASAVLDLLEYKIQSC